MGREVWVGEARVVLMVCVVLVISLAFSSVWFFVTTQSLERQVNTLQTQNAQLQNEIAAHNAPQLHEVNVQWTDNRPRFGSPHISIRGSIFNSGSESTHDVILTVRVFDSAGTLLKSEELHLGTIYGKSYIAFDVDIPYSGDADSVRTTLND